MAGHQNKLNALLEVFHVDLQPSKIGSAHVCGDDARCDYVSRRPSLHWILRGPTFAPSRINPCRASRTRSSFKPCSRQTRSRGRAILGRPPSVCQSHPPSGNGKVQQRRRRYRRPASASIRLHTGPRCYLIYSHQLALTRPPPRCLRHPAPTMLSAPENRPLAAPQYRQSLIWVNFARGYAAGDRSG